MALLLALQVAIAEALATGMATIAGRVQALASRLRERLAELPHVRLHDLGSGPRSGIVSFTVEGEAATATRARLASQGIHVGANGVPYTPLDMQARGLDGIVRASVSPLNDESDIERLASAL